MIPGAGEILPPLFTLGLEIFFSAQLAELMWSM